MTCAQKIKLLREQANLTQTELGQRLGVQKNAVSKWETGRVTAIPADKIKAMAELFHVRPSYFIDGCDDDDPRGPVIREITGILSDMTPAQLSEVARYIRYIKSST